MPMLALLFASGVCLALVLGCVFATGRVRYLFLIWNLFLAWVPLGFALLACDEAREFWTWRFGCLMAAWLLFFPNAPYIFTDIIHLTTRYYARFWLDLPLILLCAFTGLVLGFVSLYLMQARISRAFSPAIGWLFVTVVAGLSGFGIYLGRFLRFNSWDVVVKPMTFYRGVGAVANDAFTQPATIGFAGLFATFTLIAYVTLYALTHLQNIQPLPLSKGSSAR